MPTVPLSILDLAAVGKDETVGESLAGSVALARLAEQTGYRRVWYAEHHNIASIASSATAVLIAHVAGGTERIRVGSGGIMLPNHAPLVIAEQFGTLESLFPGRIDLGLGRAPGGDIRTARALRRHPGAADTFTDDLAELRSVPRQLVFRYPSADAYLDEWRRWYGPTQKAFEAVGEAGAAALASDILDLVASHDRAGDGSMVVHSDYLETVIVRR